MARATAAGVTVFPVDARGLKCPLPVLLARRALKQHAAIELTTTDAASILDIPVFCAEAGHTIIRQARSADDFHYWIARQAPA
jgi:tRNA 2-thiouridine synthesizing protein A